MADDTITDIIDLIKGAGMDIIINLDMSGGPLDEEFDLSESIDIIPGGLGVFAAGISVAGGADVA